MRLGRTAPLVLGLVLLASTACSKAEPKSPGNGPTPTAPTDEAAKESEQEGDTDPEPEPELLVAHSCNGERLARRLVEDFEVPETVGVFKPNPASLPEGGMDGASGKAFAAVSKATVLIRVGNARGTGAVVDPSGYVLTNFHVVAGRINDDLGLEATTYLPQVAQDGTVSPSAKGYPTLVVKTDQARDLALLKVELPEELDGKLPYLKMGKAVADGDPLITVGHGSETALWDSRTCKVERQVKLREALGTGKGRDPNFWEAVNPGKVIQTGCTITGGFSGGPVATLEGELVALNQVGVASKGWYFHVHRDELAEFLSDIPDQPEQILPDPYCAYTYKELQGEKGLRHGMHDLDGDGLPEVIRTQARSSTVFVDLDEDTFQGNESEHPIDAEIVVYVQRKRGRRWKRFRSFVWLDTDLDGQLDELLLSSEGIDQPPQRAYRRIDGRWTKRAKPPKTFFDVEAFDKSGNEAVRRRLAKAMQYLSGAEVAFDAAVPGDPTLKTADSGRLRDLDGDGTPEDITLESAFLTTHMLDLDEDSKELKGEQLDEKGVRKAKFDVELSLLSSGNNRWAFYDRDLDGRFDLVTAYDDDSPLHEATAAWSRGEADWVEAPEYVGRVAVSKDYFDRPPGTRFDKFAQLHLGDDFTGPALHGYPDPRKVEAASYESIDLGHDDIKAFRGEYEGMEIHWFDLQPGPGRGKFRPACQTEGPELRYQVAMVVAPRVAWTFLNVDADPAPDYVVVVGEDGAPRAAADLRGEAVTPVKLEGSHPLQPQLFADPALRAAVTAFGDRHVNQG